MILVILFRCAHGSIDCDLHFSTFGFLPECDSDFNLQPRAISASVQRQSIRPSLNGMPSDGRIFPRFSQRLRVLNPTPICLAASSVLQVFSTATPFPALQDHKVNFEVTQGIADLVSRILGEQHKVWRITVSVFRVPHVVEIGRNLLGVWP
jgi:hypothetical protein